MNEQKMQEFLGKIVVDAGAAMSSALVVIGDRLGLYKTLAKGPATPTELSQRAGIAERYAREWCANQAAGGYLTYDAESGRYTLPAEHVPVLADEDSPAFVPGLFQVTQAVFEGIPKIEKRFKSGGGLAWGDQASCLFEGTERFFRAGYVGNLIQSWIPALDGVADKLKAGARVADVGCGHGASTILMAQAYPKSQFIGFDYHAESIRVANERAREAGVADRLRFEVAGAADYPGTYDFVAHFDCLHDMADPLGAARHVRKSLAEGGTWMVVEPFANDRVQDNLNPVGRLFYAASTTLCVPCSLAGNGPALGAQAGGARLSGLLAEGGFRKVRVAAQTPFNMIFEARA
jgi:SAM-dependent methyltransferase